jgi:transposase-like protein
MSVAEPADRSSYRGYRFPPEIIGHAVWLYFRFHLSFRDVQDLLDERGVVEPRVVITDKLASYPPAIRRTLPNSEHRRHKGLNNRAENSHLPTRKRERILQRFKSADHARRFLVPFSAVSNHFRPRRHRLTGPPIDSSAPRHTPSGST